MSTVSAGAGLIIIHAVGYLTAVFLVLSPVKAVVFITVQQGGRGYAEIPGA